MEWERIRKQPEERSGAGLPNYEEYVSAFSWTQARALLDGLPGGGLNIAHEAVDRHLRAGRGDKLALRWIGRDDRIRDFSYSALGAATNRFANVLARRGVTKGDRVFSLLGRMPELYFAALGTLKNGSVFSPLFSAFGPEPIKARMSIGSAKVLVTSEAFYRRKIEPWRKELAEPGACLPDRFLGHSPARHDRPGSRDGGGVGFVRDRVDRARRHGLVALHQRHDRTSEGRRARARGRRGASYHRPPRTRPQTG